MFLKRFGLAVLFLIPANSVWAECRTDQNWGQAAHFLVNGVINRPVPEIVFDLPGNSLGIGGTVVSTTVNDRGGNRTLNNHVRFRLRVNNRSSTHMLMQTDTSSSLNCTNCASSVSVPFSKLSWVAGNSNEDRGNAPSAGSFNNSVQTWISAPRGRDNIFNLQFNFQNDEILPAGTYTGQFLTRGVPN